MYFSVKSQWPARSFAVVHLRGRALLLDCKDCVFPMPSLWSVTAAGRLFVGRLERGSKEGVSPQCDSLSEAARVRSLLRLSVCDVG